MSSTFPLVSVLLPVYNGIPYIAPAIDSIINQSYPHLEIIIINDGSTDETGTVLREYAQRDERISVHTQENRGLIETLNAGLEITSGKYIARMDADDISHSDRIKRQVEYLEANPSIGILGTRVHKVDVNNKPLTEWGSPLLPAENAWQLLYTTPLCHPSVVIRRSVAIDLGGYAQWPLYAEDYELWTRAAQITRISNLPDVLHRLRRHDDSITIRRRDEQLRMMCKIAYRYHKQYLGQDADLDLAGYLVLMNGLDIGSSSERYNHIEPNDVALYLVRLFQALSENYTEDDGLDRVRARILRLLVHLGRHVQKNNGTLSTAQYIRSTYGALGTGTVFRLFRSRATNTD